MQQKQSYIVEKMKTCADEKLQFPGFVHVTTNIYNPRILMIRNQIKKKLGLALPLDNRNY
jgi:hypothetical protein